MNFRQILIQLSARTIEIRVGKEDVALATYNSLVIRPEMNFIPAESIVVNGRKVITTSRGIIHECIESKIVETIEIPNHDCNCCKKYKVIFIPGKLKEYLDFIENGVVKSEPYLEIIDKVVADDKEYKIEDRIVT